jgi:hypothetical protein
LQIPQFPRFVCFLTYLPWSYTIPYFLIHSFTYYPYNPELLPVSLLPRHITSYHIASIHPSLLLPYNLFSIPSIPSSSPSVLPSPRIYSLRSYSNNNLYRSHCPFSRPTDNCTILDLIAGYQQRINQQTHINTLSNPFQEVRPFSCSCALALLSTRLFPKFSPFHSFSASRISCLASMYLSLCDPFLFCMQSYDHNGAILFV